MAMLSVYWIWLFGRLYITLSVFDGSETEVLFLRKSTEPEVLSQAPSCSFFAISQCANKLSSYKTLLWFSYQVLAKVKEVREADCHRWWFLSEWTELGEDSCELSRVESKCSIFQFAGTDRQWKKPASSRSTGKVWGHELCKSLQQIDSMKRAWCGPGTFLNKKQKTAGGRSLGRDVCGEHGLSVVQGAQTVILGVRAYWEWRDVDSTFHTSGTPPLWDLLIIVQIILVHFCLLLFTPSTKMIHYRNLRTWYSSQEFGQVSDGVAATLARELSQSRKCAT